MVIGDDSCSRGRGFKSQQCLLDGHFFTFICCKNCNVFEKTKINEKEVGVDTFLMKKDNNAF